MQGERNGDGVCVRRLALADLDAAAVIARLASWSDPRTRLRFYLARAACYPLVVTVDGAVAGLGVGTRNGAVGWLGDIVVGPAFRRRGLGTLLTRALIERLESDGCRTLLLTATALGRPIYERLGFAYETEYLVLAAPASATLPVEPRARAISAADLPALCALDRAATGEDRAHLLHALAEEGWLVSDETTGAPVGFAIPTLWGTGGVVALEPAVGLSLVALCGRATTLPAENAVGRAYLEAAGFTEVRRAPRLIRGAPVTWRPDTIWGTFSLALG